MRRFPQETYRKRSFLLYLKFEFGLLSSLFKPFIGRVRPKARNHIKNR